MADSEDERDLKRRDKFSSDRRGGYDDEWKDPRADLPASYGGYRGSRNYDRRDRGSPDGRASPPHKRIRSENGAADRIAPPRRRDEESDGFQPVMMSFKAFLATQDDSITDEDAIKRYSEYKQEFRRQQLNEFFVLHKGEEWFKQKYHPGESKKRKEEQRNAIKRRLEIFMSLLEGGKLDKLNLDHSNEENIVKLLDEVVIRLEKVDAKRRLEKDKGSVKSDDTSVEKEEIKKEATEGEKCGGNGEANGTAGEDVKEEMAEGDENQELHKTSSIFLKTLAPGVTKQEVEALCKRYPGFLRACIADPAPEKKWVRRGWVSFKRDVKIKEICFALNNVRLRNMELGPVVNKDLSKRVRSVGGIVQDKKIVRSDIQLAAKMIANLDSMSGLWQKVDDSLEKVDATDKSVAADPPATGNGIFMTASSNPLLANITDYLIEEEGAEEAELLGKKECEDASAGQEGVEVTRDEDLVVVLDKLVLYLRIVHSVDFYNSADYANEDEMPNRCGIVHARGPVPGDKVTGAEVEAYMKGFEKKMSAFMAPKQTLSDDEAGRLGLKNQEDEVEKFVLANTQELGKDKWLCPLSGKKFKGPEFVRKHIFNKHGDQVERAKTEVTFFNNYLKDPKRPELPENPRNKPPASARPAPAAVKRPREVTPDRRRQGRPSPEPPRRTGVHARLGHNTMRVTQATKDPRAIVDYSDVDFLGGDLF